MSSYSGKCDVYDSLVMIHNYTDEELANNVKIYQGYGDKEKLLDIKCRKDLIPYYAHLISSSAQNNVDRTAHIHITSESFVDSEEHESLEFKMKRVLTVYNRCKRKKIDFVVDDVVEELAWKGFDDHIYREIATRVQSNGKKANLDGIHMRMHEYYRKELVKEMINNGLNPLDYGDYQRFL